MENRRRELEQRRLRRKRERDRRLLAGGLAAGVLCLAVGAWAVLGRLEDSEKPYDDVSGALSGMADGNGPAAESGKETAVAAELVPREAEAIQGATEKLPSRFDLREQGTAPEVPDQGTFGTCWAFASLGALESSMPEEVRTRLSADHMSLKNSFGLGQNVGGDYTISTAYLLAWQGPVAAADDPYGDGVSPENLEPVCHVQEIQILGKKDLDAIKRAVYENGGVQSSFYMPQMAGTERDRYYNEETDAFYYDGSLEANHDVVIVGWEDTYPKENFVKEPEEDGAFLCMNTWGESFGDRGYFYISYEDSRIGTSNVSYTRVESPENYDLICQTDLCGWTGQLGYGVSEAWFGNVYEAVEDGFLAAAGFYATAPDTSYRVYVAVSEGENDGDIGTFFANRKFVAEGHVDNAGFYTVEWDTEVPLEAGERFAVIVEIESAETTEPVAVEYAAGERTSKVDISDGEGYISPDGNSWQRAETDLRCNVCLKAYVRR